MLCLNRQAEDALKEQFLQAETEPEVTCQLSPDRPRATTPEKNLVPPGQPMEFQVDEYKLRDITCCPWAKTAIATHPAYSSNLLLIRPCKRWGCPVCSQQKIRALAQGVHAANPDRLLTLTVDPANHDDPELAWLDTKRKPAEFFRMLRARGIKCEYLKVTELTKKGYPHYHCLLRSDYIPQPVAKAAWNKLTGASIVDIRQVTKQFSAFTYLVKYLTKLHRLDWTDRHVSYSRGFFPCPPSQDDHSNDLLVRIVETVDEHPYAYAVRKYRNQPLTRLSPYRWLLNQVENNYESEPDYLTLGIFKPKAEPAKTQKNLIDF